MSDELTYDERMYLQKLFYSHHEEIERKLKEELTVLSKYKYELAKNYEKSGAYQNTLISCMKDIIDKQEALESIVYDLIKVITGKYPDSEERVNAITV